MAQWESYSNKMVTDGNLLFAGVFDHKGNAWAKSGEGCGTGATPSEVSSLVSVIRDKAHLDDGVKIGGIDFMVANVFEFEDTCVIKRKNLPENSQEKDKLDVVVALTAMTCLVGISAGGQGKGGKLKKIVCDTQNYLLQSNY